MKALRYFSAFSGIGVTELAFKKVFPDSVCVGYSEIDENAIAVYRNHFPNHKNFGDITKIKAENLPKFDFFIMGSPCTDLSSFQFTKLEWNGTRSILFFDALKILKKCKPKYFLMENVASMRKERCKDISDAIGVEPVKINSVSFGVQHRRRLYWANFPIREPAINLEDRPFVEDILEKNIKRDKPLDLHFKGKPIADGLILKKGTKPYNISHKNHKTYQPRPDNKCNPVLTTSSLINIVWDGGQLRYMTSIELERLQTLPDNYTKYGLYPNDERKEITKTKRQKLIGNAFHLSTIVYILEELIKSR